MATGERHETSTPGRGSSQQSDESAVSWQTSSLIRAGQVLRPEAGGSASRASLRARRSRWCGSRHRSSGSSDLLVSRRERGDEPVWQTVRVEVTPTNLTPVLTDATHLHRALCRFRVVERRELPLG